MTFEYSAHGERLRLTPTTHTTSTSEVYAGRIHGTPVALKLLPDERGVHAAVLQHRLRHPAIAHVYGVLADGHVTPPLMYAVTERAEGPLLPSLSPGGVLHAANLAARLRWTLQAATALRFLHACDLVHGHLDAGALLVSHYTPAGAAKLSSFGAARVVTATTGTVVPPVPVRTLADVTPATLPYIDPDVLAAATGRSTPPERAAAAAAWDVYGFGMLAYQVLTGEVPYEAVLGAPGPARTGDAIDAILRGARPDAVTLTAKGVPRTATAIIAACWAPDPADRPTMDAVVAALVASVTEAPTTTTPAPPPTTTVVHATAKSGHHMAAHMPSHALHLHLASVARLATVATRYGFQSCAAMEPLVEVLANRATDADTAAAACAAIANVSGSDASQESFRLVGGIPPLAALMRRIPLFAGTGAAVIPPLADVLVSQSATPDGRVALRLGGILPLVATLLAAHTGDRTAVISLCRTVGAAVADVPESQAAWASVVPGGGVALLLRVAAAHAGDAGVCAAVARALSANAHGAPHAMLLAMCADGVMPVLVSFLAPGSPSDLHLAALDTIQALLADADDPQPAASAFCGARGMAAVAALLADTTNVPTVSVVRAACAVVRGGAVAHAGELAWLAAGGIPVLLDVVRNHAADTTTLAAAAGALQNVVVDGACETAFREAGGLRALAAILAAHADVPAVVAPAAAALRNATVDHASVDAAVLCGLPAVAARALAASGDTPRAAAAVAALVANLCVSRLGAAAFGAAGGMPPLLAALRTHATDSAVVHAATAAVVASTVDADNLAAARAAGALDTLRAIVDHPPTPVHGDGTDCAGLARLALERFRWA